MIPLENKIKEIVLNAYSWGRWNVAITGDEPVVNMWTKEALECAIRSDRDNKDILSARVDNMESDLQYLLRLELLK